MRRAERVNEYTSPLNLAQISEPTGCNMVVLSTVGVLILLGSASASYICQSTAGGRPRAASSRPRFSAARAAQANEYDVWWEERRVRNAAAAQQFQEAQQNAVAIDTGTAAGRAALRAARAEAARAEAARFEESGEAPTTLAIDEDFWWTRPAMTGEVSEMGWRPPPGSSIGLVLTEFVESSYAKAVMSNGRIDENDRGTVRGMFAEVRLSDGTLELTMGPAMENIEGLLDRLSRYLRARIPQIKEIHQMLRDGRNIL